MIEYLRGTLLEKDDHHLVLEVGGVGYGLSVPAPTSRAAGEIGGEARLWVRTYVREDTLRLFGFATRQERQVFDIILGFSGIGPSIGLALLSDLSIAEIVNAAAAGNAGPFRKVKGIGPKLADKLLLELKSHVGKLAAGLPPAAAGQAAAAPELATDAARDAVAALEALDVRPAQAARAIAIALENLGPGAGTAALVREGLKHRHASAG